MKNEDKIKILMVDDRIENLITLKAVLESDDYDLIEAKSGEEALRKVLQHDFAVILLDVQMPGLNGFETADIIKQRESSKHIPIIFITAINKENEHVSKGYSKGAVDYIFKPFNPHMLRSKVEAFVNIYKNKLEIESQRNVLKEKTEELNEGYLNLEKTIQEKTKELLNTNKELQLSQDHFRKIFQSSPNLMAIRSLKDYRYINVNKSWSQFTGYDLDDVEGSNKNWIKLTPKVKISNTETPLPLDIQAGKFNENVIYMTKGEEVREGLLSTEILTINGEKCVISALTDITENVKLEKQISRLDRLNLVGEMAAGIAHEIRNPMTTVLGFLQLTKNEQEKPDTKEYFNLMIDELNRANHIITEYLSLAKDKKTHKQSQNMNSIIESLSPLLQAEALMNNKDVKLELEECPDIYLDEKEIRQLILNIAINGLEAMVDTGLLTIRTYKRGCNVILEIEDEGPGMKKEILENLGKPFYTTKDGGTGLGLPICYSVASRHSAEIDIKSTNEGTTFVIEFPVEQPIVQGKESKYIKT
ncbi:response regulator [Evansella sp. AB-P1]|uniref:ATP-binding response regulator n=1 Tax=Evansella sp. AB-P1 TaxID=3037653 RepID=UPI00241F2778|nr:response regulator [Evansella sp. AB-P1]MDG5789955.1 response regulator [Evansella sp. AB-P1]